MAHAQVIDEILGPLQSPDGEGGLLGKLHRLVRRGLPARVIDRLEKLLALSPPQSARLLAISESSRKRYKQTPTKRLDEAASDRIVRLMTTIVEAEEIFGDRSKAIAWLKTPSLALNGLQPLDLMTSDPGAQLVRDELNRVRYGHWA
jgi:putative toxin-antitoxin system antitoxin component (TIGR02293 family)